jgi:hypothetical protein
MGIQVDYSEKQLGMLFTPIYLGWGINGKKATPDIQFSLSPPTMLCTNIDTLAEMKQGCGADYAVSAIGVITLSPTAWRLLNMSASQAILNEGDGNYLMDLLIGQTHKHLQFEVDACVCDMSTQVKWHDSHAVIECVMSYPCSQETWDRTFHLAETMVQAATALQDMRDKKALASSQAPDVSGLLGKFKLPPTGH